MSDGRAGEEGGCRCGRLRFRVADRPLLTAACHCRGCQLMTGGAYSLSSAYDAAGFELLSGEPVIGGLHDEAVQHYHCAHCLSWVFTRPPALPDLVNVRTTLLDRPPADRPFLESYAGKALPWALTGASHSFDKFPPVELYPSLLAEFAAT